MPTKIDEPIALAIDMEHAAAIGYVAVAWAGFELVLNAHICILGGFQFEAGSCLTANIVSVHSRLTALSALVHLAGGDKDVLNAISNFAGVTYEIAGKRNRIVHDPWALGESTGNHYRLEISANKRFVFEHKIEGKEEILATAKRIKLHIENFYSLWDKIIHDPGVHKSLREKYQPQLSPLQTNQ